MGRKAKRTGTPTSVPPPVPKDKPCALSPAVPASLSEVRSIYHSLITNFKAKRKLRHRNETFHISLLKGDIKHKLYTAISGLRASFPENDLQNVMRDFGDGLAEVLAGEIPDITVREEFQAWMSETSSLMSAIGGEFNAVVLELFSSRFDLAQEFKLSILERANRSFAERLAPKGPRIVARMSARKRGSWLVPPKPSEDPKLGNMSLDQIMDFISEVEETQSEPQDDFSSEVAQFRRRLESAWILERKVVPLVSEEWLQRVCQRHRVTAV